MDSSILSERYVLVTGGAGYIGSHACKALRLAGYVPVCYDNLTYGHRRAVQWGPLEIGDIGDRPRLSEVLQRYRPEAILHFAAFAYVGESVENPGKYYRNNVAGTLTLLEAMRDHGVDKIIFSSTCATYGIPDAVPISEAHSQQPINPYGASKLMVERMLLDFDRAHGIKSVALRYFNAAGADPDGEIGEQHDPETHLIPLVLEVALGKRGCVSIYGTDYATADGTCIRDYIHVSDLADAHVRALRYLEGGGVSTAFNLGNGAGFSVREIIDRAVAVTGQPIAVATAPRRAGDPPELVGSAEKARQLLNWVPRYANLDVIIGTAWQWQKKVRAGAGGSGTGT